MVGPLRVTDPPNPAPTLEASDEAAARGAEIAARFPWCATFESSTERLRPGETLLVSVEGARATLWGAAPEPVPLRTSAKARHLIGRAQQSAAFCWRLAARDAPLLRRPERLHRPGAWRAVPIARSGQGRSPAALDGSSFGLALLLGAVSWLTDAPLPADVVALGAVDTLGRITPVDGLDRKIRVLLEKAPGVRQILVAQAQRDEVAALVPPDGPRATGVACAAEAVAQVTSPDHMPWDVSAARRALDQLYRQTLLDEVSLLGWDAVHSTATTLRAVLTKPDDVLRLGLIQAISARHAGRAFTPPDVDLEWLEVQPRPLRLVIMAQLIQGCADQPNRDLEEMVARGLALVAQPVERHAEDLILLGACARARAALAQDLDACRLAEQATRGWMAIGRPASSSKALCEWLRLLGLVGRADELAAAIDGVVLPLLEEPGLADLDRSFIALALGRALTLTEQPEQALAWLGHERDESSLPVHLRLAQRRWKARALVQLGRNADAEDERQILQTLEPGNDPNLLLAALDGALERNEDPTSFIEALVRGEEGATFARLAGPPPWDRNAATRVADRYAY